MRLSLIIFILVCLSFSISIKGQKTIDELGVLSLEAMINKAVNDHSLPVSEFLVIDNQVYSASVFVNSDTEIWEAKVKAYQVKYLYNSLVYNYNCKRLWKPVLKKLSSLSKIAEASFELGEIDHTEKLQIESFQLKCKNEYDQILFEILHHTNELKVLLNSESDFFPIEDSLIINRNISDIKKSSSFSEKKAEITKDEIEFMSQKIKNLNASNLVLATTILKTSTLKLKKEDISLYDHILNQKEALNLQIQFLKQVKQHNLKTAKYEFFNTL